MSNAKLTTSPARRRPTSAELAAAGDKTIPDVTGPGLHVLFCGINPSLYSAAVGRHFARPGNRFWPALYRSGFTPREFRPDEQDQLVGLGLGITNIVARATARADELSAEELAASGHLLRAKCARLRPRWLAVLGVTSYRIAFGQPQAAVGAQDLRLDSTALWVLPNPSGLNAHWTITQLVGAFRELKESAGQAP